MQPLLEREKLEMKGRLLSAISSYINNETADDNNIGYIPDNLDVLMTNAAFGILEAVNATNVSVAENL